MNGYVHPDRVTRSRASDATTPLPSRANVSVRPIGPVHLPTVSSLLRAAFPGRGRAKVAGREFGLHPDTVRHWASGRVVPGADRLLALAAQNRALRRELLRVLQDMEEASGG